MKRRTRKRPLPHCFLYENPKTAYRSEKLARRQLFVLQSRYSKFTFRMFVCQGCGWWHIGRAEQTGHDQPGDG
jgi:hypothetical protein